MKARVKATGEIVEVEPSQTAYTKRGDVLTIYEDCVTREMYSGTDLDFIDDYEPDYWDKLKHQYAGMAMQGILTNLGNTISPDYITEEAEAYATALVNKLMEDKK